MVGCPEEHLAHRLSSQRVAILCNHARVRQSRNQEKWPQSEKWPLPCGDRWQSTQFFSYLFNISLFCILEGLFKTFGHTPWNVTLCHWNILGFDVFCGYQWKSGLKHIIRGVICGSGMSDSSEAGIPTEKVQWVGGTLSHTNYLLCAQLDILPGVKHIQEKVKVWSRKKKVKVYSRKFKSLPLSGHTPTIYYVVTPNLAELKQAREQCSKLSLVFVF